MEERRPSLTRRVELHPPRQANGISVSVRGRFVLELPVDGNHARRQNQNP